MRLVLLILLLTPAIAFADEGTVMQIVGYAIIYFAPALAGWGYALIVAGGVYGADQARKKAAEQRDAARRARNAALQDRTLTRVASDAPHRTIYGRARVGSDIVAMFASGARDEYKWLVCVHAAHECDAIEEIYINGKALGTLDGNGDVTGGDYFSTRTDQQSETKTGASFSLLYTPVPGTLSIVKPAGDGYETVPYTLAGAAVTLTQDYGQVTCSYQHIVNLPRVRVTKHLGAPSDAADAGLMAAVPAKWFATSVLRGYLYTVVRLDLNHPELQGGLPSIEVLARGKKLYDLRDTTTAWSSNPALATYDYLTGDICGVDAADLPAADYIAAANVCDEDIGGGVKRYVCNGTVNADQDPRRVLETLAQCMAGSIVATTWGCSAGKYVAPVMALEQSDIVGALTIIRGTPAADLYNGVRGQYIGPENQYVATDFKPFQNAAYVTADGSELWTNIEFPFTDDVQHIHNLARIFCEDQRNGLTVKAAFSLKTWALKPFNRVTLTSAVFGWSAKVFRVTDKRFGPEQMVELTLKEDAASIWDEADAVTADSTPNTGLPDPFALGKLNQLVCASGTGALLMLADGSIVSRILASWPQTENAYVAANGLIEIEWQMIGSDVWNKFTVSGAETQAYLSPVEDGAFYTVRARPVNTTLGVKADWIYAGAHQVIGKTEPPPDLTGFTLAGTVLNWTSAEALDLAGYIFRFHYGNNLDWGSAVPLHGGIITESPFDLVVRPSGVVTIMGKALDTSGNESQATANIFADLGDAAIANIIETFDFDPAYLGTLTGCTVSGGDVVADSLDSFYGTDEQSFYGADADSFYEPSAFGAMSYVTEDVAINSALAGSLMTLALTTQGADLIVEYRQADPAPFYGADGESFYGADADPFYGVPGAWMPWPGQVIAANDVYNFRAGIGAGATQGKITAMLLTIDAPDMVEELADVAIGSGGTTIAYTRPFTSIKTVQATLQANGSGAETVEIDKTSPLAPSIKAYNAAHTAVSGSTADITLKGY